ncbi:BTB/POZ-like domain containing protein [Pseudohyphozyma bogoriensis]|nr:BTB/POZ-like domain containing protein [Pseudohyphozyma bogoriensis]
MEQKRALEVTHNGSSKTLQFQLSLNGAHFKVAPSSSSIQATAGRLQELIKSPHPNDVLLRFKTGEELWSSFKILCTSSHFKTLLSSGFSEGKKGSPSRDSVLSAKKMPEEDYDDSDDDSERTLIEAPIATDILHHTIEVTSASYSTYRAVLVWMYSGYIQFAPLKSTFTYPSTTPPKTLHCLSPVSPKSVYRLSHYLELPKLSQLALASFESQLSVANVGAELFSDVASSFPEIRDVCVKLAVKNWAEVKKMSHKVDITFTSPTLTWDGVDVFVPLSPNPPSPLPKTVVAFINQKTPNYYEAGVLFSGPPPFRCSSASMGIADPKGNFIVQMSQFSIEPGVAEQTCDIRFFHYVKGPITVVLKLQGYEPYRNKTPSELSRTSVAEKMSVLFDSQHPNDVCLRFPSGSLLWTNSAILSTSPYLLTLLSSSFREAQKRAGPTKSSTNSSKGDFDDSDDDDEREAQTVRSHSLSNLKEEATSDEGSGCSAKFHTIDVTSGSYNTYRAVLNWIYTGHIDFAPLSSTFTYPSSPSSPPSSASSASSSLSPPQPQPQPQIHTRSSHLFTFRTQNPLLPLPVSPKSVFRLSHFLEMPELRRIALAAYKGQLTASNVAFELFDGAAASYEEIKEACLDVAMDHWDEVRASKAFKTVQAACDAGDRQVPTILFELIKRFDKKIEYWDERQASALERVKSGGGK